MPPVVLAASTNLVHLPQVSTSVFPPLKTPSKAEVSARRAEYWTRPDASGTAMRLPVEVPVALSGPITQLVHDCFDEDLYEQGLDLLNTICSQTIVPTKAHIRQIFALALCSASPSMNPQPQPPRPDSEVIQQAETGQPKSVSILSARAFLVDCGSMSALNATHVLSTLPPLSSDANTSASSMANRAVAVRSSPVDSEHIDASAIAQHNTRIRKMQNGIFRGLLRMDEFWAIRSRSSASGKGKGKGKGKARQMDALSVLPDEEEEEEAQEDEDSDADASPEALLHDPMDLARGQPHSEGAWATLGVLVKLWKKQRLALEEQLAEEEHRSETDDVRRERFVGALHIAQQFRGLSVPTASDAKPRKKLRRLEPTSDVGHALDLAFAPFGLSRTKEARRHAKRVRVLGLQPNAIPLPDAAEMAARRKVAAAFLLEVLHLAILPTPLLESDALVRGIARKLRGVAWDGLTELDEALRCSPSAHLLFARAVTLMLRARVQKHAVSDGGDWIIADHLHALIPRASPTDQESLQLLLSELARPLSSLPTSYDLNALSLLLPLRTPTVRSTILHMRPAALARLRTVAPLHQDNVRVVLPLPRSKTSQRTEVRSDVEIAKALAWRLADLADTFSVIEEPSSLRGTTLPWLPRHSMRGQTPALPFGPRSKKISTLARKDLHGHWKSNPEASSVDEATLEEEKVYDVLALGLTAEVRRAQLSALSVDLYARYMLLRTVVQWAHRLVRGTDEVDVQTIRRVSSSSMGPLMNALESVLDRAELSIDALEARLDRDSRNWKDEEETRKEDPLAPLRMEGRSMLRMAVRDARAQLGRVQGVMDAAALGAMRDDGFEEEPAAAATDEADTTVATPDRGASTVGIDVYNANSDYSSPFSEMSTSSDFIAISVSPRSSQMKGKVPMTSTPAGKPSRDAADADEDEEMQDGSPPVSPLRVPKREPTNSGSSSKRAVSQAIVSIPPRTPTGHTQSPSQARSASRTHGTSSSSVPRPSQDSPSRPRPRPRPVVSVRLSPSPRKKAAPMAGSSAMLAIEISSGSSGANSSTSASSDGFAIVEE